MAERELTAQEQIVADGKRAKVEHAKRHGDASPTSKAATAEECGKLGDKLGLGTPTVIAGKAQAPVEDKAVSGPQE